MEDSHSTSEVVSNEVIEDLSSEISKDGLRLGRRLGLLDAAIADIKAEFKEQQEANYQILLKWKQKQGKKATCAVLREALVKIHRTDLAEKYFGDSDQSAKKEPAKTQPRKRKTTSKESGPAKRQKKNPTSTKVTPAKDSDQSTKKEPTKTQPRKGETSKETGPAKRQKKNPTSTKGTTAKGKVGGPNTEHKGSKGTISLQIVRKEERGFPKPHPKTGTWLRAKFKAANESDWYDIAIWGVQEKEKLSLFKKGGCVTLKGFILKGNDISLSETALVEKCDTQITISKDVEHKMEKYEKKSYKTLDDIKQSGQSSKTKLRVCEVGECKEIQRTTDGKKIVLRELKVKNKKTKKDPEEVVLFGDDARSKTLKKGQTIVLNVGYNTARRKFETTGTFIMKICPKSKKKKSKKKQKSK